MKAQLLEDIGDSHPRPPPPRQPPPQTPPQAAAQAAPRPAPQATPQPAPQATAQVAAQAEAHGAPQPAAEAGQEPAPSPRAAAAPEGASASAREGVWRRPPEAAPEAPAWPPPLSDDPWASDPPPVWNVPNEPAYSPAPDEPDWFERWGRRAATGTAVLLATLALGGAGLWLYNENKMDKSLSVLAKAPIPARQAKPVPSVSPQPGGTQAALAAQTGTPAAAPSAAGPEPAGSAGPAKPASSASAADSVVATAATPAPAAPAAEPAPRVADTSPPQAAGQAPAAAGAALPERPRKRAVASKSKAAPSVQAQARYASNKSERSDKSDRNGKWERNDNVEHNDKEERGDPLKETLRQCRAAGYHAARCVQLGCNATKYGLVCKGGTAARR